VVTAAPPTPGPSQHPSDAEEVGRMCQQLAQCVGSCDLHQEASSSGRKQHEHVASGASTMQVMCYMHVYHRYRTDLAKAASCPGFRDLNVVAHVATHLV